jgi:hypothetical protein
VKQVVSPHHGERVGTISSTGNDYSLFSLISLPPHQIIDMAPSLTIIIALGLLDVDYFVSNF